MIALREYNPGTREYWHEYLSGIFSTKLLYLPDKKYLKKKECTFNSQRIKYYDKIIKSACSDLILNFQMVRIEWAMLIHKFETILTYKKRYWRLIDYGPVFSDIKRLALAFSQLVIQFWQKQPLWPVTLFKKRPWHTGTFL